MTLEHHKVGNGFAIAGLDYSINSPCICIFDPVNQDDAFDIKRCYFYLITVKKSEIGSCFSDRIEFLHRDIKEIGNDFDVARYVFNAEMFSDILNHHDCQEVGIEDYSFGSKGRVFHIGENGGIMKASLLFSAITYNVYAPSEIKKFATGKGNANKKDMYESFLNETSVDIVDEVYNKRGKKTPKDAIGASPVSDIIDAYYVCKYNYFLGVSNR